jgi:hypothetical protein
MKTNFPKIFFLVLLLTSALISLSQEKQSQGVKTPMDIPHKTLREKWMWPHRTFALISFRERPVNYDTAYVKSFYKRFVITIPVSARFLKFSIFDERTGKKLTYVPNLQYNLGISISSRWASFVINSGVKVFSGNENIKGKTTYRDYQLHIYGRKIITDLVFQHYKGFYIKNSRSYETYTSEQPYSIRSDVSALNIGANTMYVVNHRRYSYGNSFAFVEQQRKSAGSLLIGVYYTYFSASGNPSLIEDPFKSNFDSLSLIKKGYTHNLGLNIGYIYTLVIKKRIYATVSVTQGVGAEQSFYTRNNNSDYDQLSAGAGKFNGTISLRYDNGRYFIGTMGTMDYFLFRGKANSTFDYSFGKAMVYLGYRFSVLKPEKKLLKKLKLIDY